MNNETLDEFITRVRCKTRGNAWVIESKFEGLYVRYGDRFIVTDERTYADVLDLANVTVEEKYRRTGVVTALVIRLRQTYPGMHLYVENATPEFGILLLRLGFNYVPFQSFFMKGVRFDILRDKHG